MSPTLKTVSILIEDKLSTHFGKPKYGDVVIISEKEIGYSIIKRVIALPGDTISIKSGTVYVNGKPLTEPYIDGKADNMKEVKVEDNKIFVMGDNRTPGESFDSRSSEMETLPISYIRGYVFHTTNL